MTPESTKREQPNPANGKSGALRKVFKELVNLRRQLFRANIADPEAFLSGCFSGNELQLRLA